MKTTLVTRTSCTSFILLFVCCIWTQPVSSAPRDDDGVSSKSKREAGGPSGLYPFPRVGRSGPDTWFMDTAGKHLFQGIFSEQPENIYQTKPVFAPQQVETDEEKKTGLFSFPRVGRSSMKVAPNEIQGLIKRQGLVPFPRIGRSGMKQNTNNGPNSANGLWFGPRLGRLQKRDSFESPWALVTLREFPSITSRRQPEPFTPRLGRESSEDVWDDYEQTQRISNDHA